MIDLDFQPAGQLKVSENPMMSAVVQIIGDWVGAVALISSDRLACEIAGMMFDCAPEDTTEEDRVDALGEMGNVIAGSIKAVVCPTSLLTPPSVVRGSDISVAVLGAREQATTVLKYKSQPFRVLLLERNGSK